MDGVWEILRLEMLEGIHGRTFFLYLLIVRARNLFNLGFSDLGPPANKYR